MGVQTRNYKLGVAKQTAKGTIASQPAHAHGIVSGGIVPVVNSELDPVSSGSRATPNVNRISAENGVSVETRAFIKGVGMWLYGLMGAYAKSGTGTITHTFTLGAACPWMSVFAYINGSNIHAVKDLKVQEMSFKWSENKPVVVSIKGVGGAFSFPASFTPGSDETGSADYFTPVGGTFKLDVDGATLAAVKCVEGEITIRNAVNPLIFSGEIEAGDIEEALQEAEVSMTVVPEDIADWRTVLTGTSSGTSVSSAPVYGSLEVVFNSGTNSLKFEATKVAYKIDLPEHTAEGGYLKVPVVGVACLPADASAPVKVTLANTHPDYAA